MKETDYLNYKFPNSKENDINLVYVGRFNSQKGLHLLLNIDIPDNVNIYFIGSSRGGNLYNVIIELCKIRKNFHFLGEKLDKEKIVILKRADAILFPSLHEPFGIVGLEAMASKTLCITTRVNGIATYMDKDMCIEIENQDIKTAIMNFLKMSNEDKNKIINKAYKRAKQYSWKLISNKMMTYIRDVVNE